MELSIFVIKFFHLLNNLAMENKAQLMADPYTADLLAESSCTGRISVTSASVYYLFMSHSNVLSAEMLSIDIIDAMSLQFDNGEWAKMGRPTMWQVAVGLRNKLSGRPVI